MKINIGLIILFVWFLMATFHWKYIVHPSLKKHRSLMIKNYLFFPYLFFKVIYRLIYER